MGINIPQSDPKRWVNTAISLIMVRLDSWVPISTWLFKISFSMHDLSCKSYLAKRTKTKKRKNKIIKNDNRSVRTTNVIMIWLIIIVTIIVVVALLLPFCVKAIVNNALSKLDGYKGQIDRLQINLWRSKISFHGVRVNTDADLIKINHYCLCPRSSFFLNGKNFWVKSWIWISWWTNLNFFSLRNSLHMKERMQLIRTGFQA